MKKIPMRKCVITQTQHPKADLLRIVLTPEGNVEIDPSGRKNGRGAYLFVSAETIVKARKNKALERALKAPIPDLLYEELENYVK